MTLNTNISADTNKPDALENIKEADISPGSQPARVISAIQKLTDLLHQENSLLQERRITETKDLQGEKAQLSTDYKNELNALKANPQSLGPKGSAVRLQLQKINTGFQEEVKNHGRILLRLKTVSENLVHAISDEASKKSGSVPHYDNMAHIHNNSKMRPVNIAHNELI